MRKMKSLKKHWHIIFKIDQINQLFDKYAIFPLTHIIKKSNVIYKKKNVLLFSYLIKSSLKKT